MASERDLWTLGGGPQTLDRLRRLTDWLRVRSDREQAALIAGTCAILALTSALVLLLPGRTVSFIYAHDLTIFLDGADRVLDGQLPNRDFHTPLGMLAYLLPALGLWLGGNFGIMMPVATSVFLLLILPILAYVCTSRLPLAYAVLFAIFTVVLIATPTSVGEVHPSFSMFYNRWGYAALGMLFLLGLRPWRGAPHPWLDAGAAVIILLACFYLKISYFIIGAAFLLLLLPFEGSRFFALLALGGILIAIGLIHLFWGGTLGYFDDIAMAARSSGLVRSSLPTLARIAVYNIAMVLPFAFLIGLALPRGLSVRGAVLSLFAAFAGFVLADQNTHALGIMTLVPAGMLAVADVLTNNRSHGRVRSQLTFGLLMMILIVPPTLSALGGMLGQFFVAMRGTEVPGETIVDIDGFLARELPREEAVSHFELLRNAYRTGHADLFTLAIARGLPVRQILAQPEYFWTVQDAVNLLQSDRRLGGSVFVLDWSNPMNALTGRSAPKGTDSWYHESRTFNASNFRPPQEIFRNVEVVMIPKAPVVVPTAHLLQKLYGDYVLRHYVLTAESDYWQAYRRREVAASAR